MPAPIEPLSTSILAITYFGDIVFAISGALTAARYKMDVLGFVLIGTTTGIGGGTTRDLLLGRTVWWTQNPLELILCVAAALITFFFIKHDISNRKGMVWSDALGLSAFGVVGCHVALDFGAPFVIAVFMGMVTATGGGVIRDVLTNTQPMILCGQVYATAALVGSLGYASLRTLGLTEVPAEAISCGAAFALRASAIVFDIRTGPPGEFLRMGGTQASVDTGVENAVDEGKEKRRVIVSATHKRRFERRRLRHFFRTKSITPLFHKFFNKGNVHVHFSSH